MLLFKTLQLEIELSTLLFVDKILITALKYYMARL